jgi:hypothetical protein
MPYDPDKPYRRTPAQNVAARQTNHQPTEPTLRYHPDHPTNQARADVVRPNHLTAPYQPT